MTFSKVFKARLTVDEALHFFQRLVTVSGEGEWVLYDLLYFGAESEEAYAMRVVNGRSGAEALMFDPRSLADALASQKIGFDWSELYFFSQNADQVRAAIRGNVALRPDITVVVDSAVWYATSSNPKIAQFIEESEHFEPSISPLSPSLDLYLVERTIKSAWPLRRPNAKSCLASTLITSSTSGRACPERAR